MQNTVYECKRNSEDFFLSLAVTYYCFGNCPANGLVTEQPQYSVVICFFSTWQNTETMLISNDLRFIFTYPLFLALPITFHTSRRTFATNLYHKGMSTLAIMSMTGHTSEANFLKYIKIEKEEYAERNQEFFTGNKTAV